jgi:DNA-binding winged helix-turn-helix (wHTH) protein/Tol biopolymer transport system component
MAGTVEARLLEGFALRRARESAPGVDMANAPQTTVVRFGVYELDLAARQLRKNGTRIKLQDQPFRVLQMLVERPGEIVTRDELREKLWPADTFVEFDHSLNTATQKIRQALGDSASAPRFLETIPKVGYRFLAPVNSPPPASEQTDHSGASSRQSAADAPASEEGPSLENEATLAAKWKPRLPWVLLAFVTLLFALTAWHPLRRPLAESPPLVRFTFTPDSLSRAPLSAAVSPNGRHIAFVSGDNSQLWIRDLDREEPRLLDGAYGNITFFWSPDSRFLGFGSDRLLKKIPVTGGPAVTICPLPPSLSVAGSWSPDGETIVLSSGATPLQEVSASGGPLKSLVDPRVQEKGEYFHVNFLPRNDAPRAVLCSMRDFLIRKVTLVNLETGESQVLADGSLPAYSPTGHIIYQAAHPKSGLWALPFSLDTLEPTGEAYSIAEHAANPSVSQDGSLVYVDLFAGEKQQLVWRDRQGNKLAAIGVPQDQIRLPTLSPDATRVAVFATDGAEESIWVHEVARPVKTRLTFGPGTLYPVWLPSGTEIAYMSESDKTWELFRRASDGAGEPFLLNQGDGPKWPNGWSADGAYLLYTTFAEKTGFDIGYLAKQSGGEFEAVSFLDSEHRERLASLSPDARFVAYCSDESGRDEVYVRSFPDGGGKMRISENGGCGPRWSGDGEELFFVENNQLLFAVAVKTAPGFTHGPPVGLFRHDRFVNNIPDYDVSADGERFVMVETVGEERADQPLRIHFVQSWFSEFRGKQN